MFAVGSLQGHWALCGVATLELACGLQLPRGRCAQVGCMVFTGGIGAPALLEAAAGCGAQVGCMVFMGGIGSAAPLEVAVGRAVGPSSCR